MRINSYVIVHTPHAAPQVGVIQAIITPHCFAVSIGEIVIRVKRKDVERMKPRERRNYRHTRRGH